MWKYLAIVTIPVTIILAIVVSRLDQRDLMMVSVMVGIVLPCLLIMAFAIVIVSSHSRDERRAARRERAELVARQPQQKPPVVVFLPPGYMPDQRDARSFPADERRARRDDTIDTEYRVVRQPQQFRGRFIQPIEGDNDEW